MKRCVSCIYGSLIAESLPKGPRYEDNTCTYILFIHGHTQTHNARNQHKLQRHTHYVPGSSEIKSNISFSENAAAVIEGKWVSERVCVRSPSPLAVRGPVRWCGTHVSNFVWVSFILQFFCSCFIHRFTFFRFRSLSVLYLSL